MTLEGEALKQLLLCTEDSYIIDDTTGELLYVSESLGAGYENAYLGCKCFKALHGLEQRCVQCPSTDLCCDTQWSGMPFYRWERFDAKRSSWYQVRHRIVWLEGRLCRIASCNVVEGMMQLGGDAIKEMGLLINLLEENSKIKQRLEHDSTHDQMTGLYNRNRYIQDLTRFVGVEMGVAYVDINNLKETNDRYGHEQGDRLICTVSRCIRVAIPADARCYRIGGDEFVVLLGGHSAADSEQFRCDFLAALAEENQRMEHCCLAACGVAHNSSPRELTTLVALAESNMYEDKKGSDAMPKAIWNFSYQLKKNVAQEQFIAATKRLHDEVVSKAKGFISWEQYLQGDTWTDLATWETLEDAKNAETLGNSNESAKDFYALLQRNTCRTLVSSLVKHYKIPTDQ